MSLPVQPTKNHQYLVITVNYNNALLTEQLLTSGLASAHAANTYVEFIVVDNSHDFDDDRISLLCNNRISLLVLQPDHNLGYFGGINYALSRHKTQLSTYDAALVMNNDMLFPLDFFSSLIKSEQILRLSAVICPQILSSNSRYENPHVDKPLSASRELLYSLLYSNFFLYRLMLFLSAAFKRPFKRFGDADNSLLVRPTPIYQGYGAAYVLTRAFFENSLAIDYPGFMYFEEFFLTEHIAKYGYLPIFVPSLLLLHIGGATTTSSSSTFTFSCQKNSFRLYRKYVKPFARFSHSVAINNYSKIYQHLASLLS